MSVATEHYVEVAPLTFTGPEVKAFTYHHGSAIEPGSVVKVPLGRGSSLGVVTARVSAPSFATKPVTEVLDLRPLPQHTIDLASWLGNYYFASAKAVWQTILPAGITKKRRQLKAIASFKLPKQDHVLNSDQQTAYDRIMNGSKTNFLVQGVTGSGKTRLYLELAAAQLSDGKSVIVLIPEIALSPQVIALFEASFPDRVIPFHSGLTEAQKHAAWQRALEADEPMVVIGPRSSLFLPLPKIGLIVIDECHETSYKQEQNPRYQAIPTAAKLAAITGAKLVLGSATPGLNEVYLAGMSKLELIKLEKRISGHAQVSTIIDLRDKAQLRSSKFIAEPLLKALGETLAARRQSLLFINRRGSASSQICNACGHVATCPNCSLPLTFHADQMKLVCHLCNHRQTPGAVCTECGSSDMRYVGGGTKRIEAEIAKLLPNARLARLDKDSADAKRLPELYEALHGGKIDILIGTQMIAKGLDLPLLDTVGVINADTALHMPDFTSAERTYQLLSQVAGRAGRGDQPGQVFIQTLTPDHPAIRKAAAEDFWGFAEAELSARKLLGYPPFRYLLKLTNTAKTAEAASRQAAETYAKLKQYQAIRLLGPAPAFHEKLGGQYHWQIVVKSSSRQPLLEVARKLPASWKTDLDPINLL
ncbi:MAG TPA: primosomal protein N' [Candidatus Saccharimonadales bacterium]|nr:primosomal protein N' [Candidatus Saccharimonadales bacterium]